MNDPGDLQHPRPVKQDCPYCGAGMSVTRMTCDRCDVAIEAAFPMSRLGSLPVEHQRFIEMFVLAGGNLKEIAEQVGVSYPTVRSRLDKIIESLRARDRQDPAGEGNGSRRRRRDPHGPPDAGRRGAAHQGDLSHERSNRERLIDQSEHARLDAAIGRADELLVDSLRRDEWRRHAPADRSSAGRRTCHDGDRRLGAARRVSWT